MPKDAPRHSGDKLDEAIEETFPASDAPANTVETGIRVDIGTPAPGEATTRDDSAVPVRPRVPSKAP